MRHTALRPNLNMIRFDNSRCFIFLMCLALLASIEARAGNPSIDLPSTIPINDQSQFISSNLPIIVIDTFGREIPDEPKIPARMGIIYHGDGIRNSITDPFNEYDGWIGIELRGSSAQGFDKKSYAVETRDSGGNNLNVSLLGMPPENDWVLYGPYSDKTLIRNVLAYRLANEMGRYASRSKCCELVLNGEYLGVYVWLEKIKRDKNRVNITRIEPTDVAGDAVTGGYIIKIDKPAGAKLDGWESPYPPFPGAWQRIFYQYHYPDQDDIVLQQKNYIRNFISSFEALMARPDYADPQNGYSRYIDVDSFVDYFLLSELSKNVDAYRLSTFFYKDRDSKNGKLFIGPVWDFNLAFGNADYYGSSFFSGWQVDFQEPDDYWQNPFWWQKLMADSHFTNKINRRWFELRQTTFSLQRIYSIIDSLVNHLNEAQRRNFERWPILGVYVWPNPFIGGNYQAEIRYLKFWIQSRMLWMDARMVGNPSAVADLGMRSESGYPSLGQNYPNPFNASTTIPIALPLECATRLVIYNVLGQPVRHLVDEILPAGHQTVVWDGQDDAGKKVSPGIYLYQLKIGDYSLNRKLLMID